MRNELLIDNEANYQFPKDNTFEEQADYTPLEQTHRILRRALKKGGYNFLKVSAGAGKTKAAFTEIQRNSDRYVSVIAMSDHGLMQGSIDKFLGNSKVLHWYGRTCEYKAMCTRKAEVQAAMNRKLDPGKVVCWKCNPKKQKGKPVEKKECRYSKQLKKLLAMKKGIIVCPYQSLSFILEVNKHISNVYVDENCLGAFYNEYRLVRLKDFETLLSMKQLDMHPKAITFINSIIELGKQVLNMKFGRFYNKKVPGNLWPRTIWEVLDKTRDDAYEEMGKCLLLISQLDEKQFDKAGVNKHVIDWLKALFDGTAWLEIATNRDSDKYAVFSYTEKNVPNLKRYNVYLLDATGDVSVMNALFDLEFTVTDVNVDYDLHITWFKHFGFGKNRSSTMEDDDITKYCAEIVKKIKLGVTKAVLVTHLDVEDRALAIIKKLTPQIEWLSGHYYALRGRNDFEDCQLIVCLGVPILNPSCNIDIASQLFPGEFDKQQSFLARLNAEELYQAIHRIRPVINSGRQAIVLGNYFPEDLIGPVTEKMELGRVGTAEERAIERLKGLEIVTKEIAASYGVGEKANEDKVKALYHGNEGLILGSHPAFWKNVVTKLAERNGMKVIKAKSMKWDKRNYILAAVDDDANLEQMGIEVEGCESVTKNKTMQMLTHKASTTDLIKKRAKTGCFGRVKNCRMLTIQDFQVL